jgi:hypothetical protein
VTAEKVANIVHTNIQSREHLSILQLVSQQSIICKAPLLENQWMQSGIPEEKLGYASFQNVM